MLHSSLQDHPEEVYACEFLADNQLLTASADKLYLWDLSTGARLQQANQTEDSNKATGKCNPTLNVNFADQFLCAQSKAKRMCPW